MAKVKKKNNKTQKLKNRNVLQQKLSAHKEKEREKVMEQLKALGYI